MGASAGGSDDTLNKLDWLHLLRQLSLQENTCQADISSAATRAQEEVKREVERQRGEAARLEGERLQEASEIRQELKKQRQVLGNVVTLVRMVKRGVDSGETLRQELESLEQMMLLFKKSRRCDYEDLNTEERLLTRELEVLTKHIESWEHTAHAPTAAASCEPKIPSAEDESSAEHGEEEDRDGTELLVSGLEARVQALNQRIIREGGATGGWHPREHEMFLGMMSQTGTGQGEVEPAALEALVDRALMVLRERSESEILEHRQWFLRYQRLIDEKRQTVKQWRTHRDQIKQDEARKKEQQAGEERRLLSSGRGRGKITYAEEKRREEQRQRVEAWREEKERRAREEDEAKSAQEAEERRAAEERMRKRTARVKQEVELYRFEKERENQRRAEVERLLHRDHHRSNTDEDGDPSVSPPRVVVDLGSRVRETLEKAKQKREEVAKKDPQRKQREREAKQKKLVEVFRESPWDESAPRLLPRQAYRDPERVSKSTRASKVRELTDEELEEKEKARVRSGAHERPMAGMGRDLQFAGRAVPEWRRGL